ncbi:replication-relaxation family protein [Plantactinospora sp. WMMB334]|uniref:replication-relaxation family protein n=1 Tax=Plantactinospora sp. WMMB334 TaxID=3404119 RepID=UPI003B93CCD4
MCSDSWWCRPRRRRWTASATHTSRAAAAIRATPRGARAVTAPAFVLSHRGLQGRPDAVTGAPAGRGGQRRRGLTASGRRPRPDATRRAVGRPAARRLSGFGTSRRPAAGCPCRAAGRALPAVHRPVPPGAVPRAAHSPESADDPAPAVGAAPLRLVRRRRPPETSYLYTLGPIGLRRHPTAYADPDDLGLKAPCSSIDRAERIAHSRRLNHLLGINQFFADLHSKTPQPARSSAAELVVRTARDRPLQHQRTHPGRHQGDQGVPRRARRVESRRRRRRLGRRRLRHRRLANCGKSSVHLFWSPPGRVTGTSPCALPGPAPPGWCPFSTCRSPRKGPCHARPPLAVRHRPTGSASRRRHPAVAAGGRRRRRAPIRPRRPLHQPAVRTRADLSVPARRHRTASGARRRKPDTCRARPRSGTAGRRHWPQPR